MAARSPVIQWRVMLSQPQEEIQCKGDLVGVPYWRGILTWIVSVLLAHHASVTGLVHTSQKYGPFIPTAVFTQCSSSGSTFLEKDRDSVNMIISHSFCKSIPLLI